jgi:NitT/TauT family transport system substrate-binding protein
MNRRRWLLLGAGAAFAGGTRRAGGQELATIKLANSRISSDAPFWIADRSGYFRDEGLKVDFLQFNSSETMMPMLSTGQIDVAGGAAGAALYNAVIRGADVRAVADTGSDPPGYGWAMLLIRSELVRSGRFKSIADLKGMTVCGAAQASSSAPQLAHVLARAGLKFGDVKRVALPYVQHQIALQNGAVDATLTVEPYATLAVESGVANKVMGDDQFYPNQQVSVLLYSGGFIKDRRELAVHFMRAYIKGARYYNDALAGGHYAGPTADAVLKIIAEELNAPPSLFQKSVPIAMNPDGHVNVASMREDLAFYKSQGFIEGTITTDRVVDDSLATEAVRQLGPYRRKRR